MFGVSPLPSVHSGDTSGAGAGGAGQVDENICFISIFNIGSLLSEDYKYIGWLFFLVLCNLSCPLLYVAEMR